MHVTKSIYFGGELIHTDNPHLNYLSSEELGLCCVFCNAETHFRAGNVRVPHFAHYPNIPSRKFEDCILRQKSYSTLGNSSLYSLTPEGRQQRLKIFQEYFLDIIATNDFKFYEKIQVIQNRQKLEHDIEKITKACAESVVDGKKTYFEYIDKYFKNIKIRNEEFSVLREKIIQEALNYLCILSSRSLLEQIIQYLIHQYDYNSEIKNNGYLKVGNNYSLKLSKLDEKYLYLNKNIQVILDGLLVILLRTNWIERIKPTQLFKLLIEKDRRAELSLKQKNITKKRRKSKGYKHGTFIGNIFYFFNLEINKPYELYKTESEYDSSELNSKHFFLNFKDNFQHPTNRHQFQLIIKTGSKKPRQWYLGCIKNIYKVSSTNRIYAQWILFSDVFHSDKELSQKDITDKVECFLRARISGDSEKIIIKSPIVMSYTKFTTYQNQSRQIYLDGFSSFLNHF